jgi:hypothetical protein
MQRQNLDDVVAQRTQSKHNGHKEIQLQNFVCFVVLRALCVH